MMKAQKINDQGMKYQLYTWSTLQQSYILDLSDVVVFELLLALKWQYLIFQQYWDYATRYGYNRHQCQTSMLARFHGLVLPGIHQQPNSDLYLTAASLKYMKDHPLQSDEKIRTLKRFQYFQVSQSILVICCPSIIVLFKANVSIQNYFTHVNKGRMA